MLDVLLDAGADLNAKSRWWAGGFGLLRLGQPRAGRLCDRARRGRGCARRGAPRNDGPARELDRMRSRPRPRPRRRRSRRRCTLPAESRSPLICSIKAPTIDARDIDHESTPAQYMVDDRQEVARYLGSRGCQTDLLMASALGDLELVDKPSRRRSRLHPHAGERRVFPEDRQASGGTIYGWTLGFYMSAHQVAASSVTKMFCTAVRPQPDPVKLIAPAGWVTKRWCIRSGRRHPNIADEFYRYRPRQVAHAARNNETTVVRLMLECGLPVDAQGPAPRHAAALGRVSRQCRDGENRLGLRPASRSRGRRLSSARRWAGPSTARKTAGTADGRLRRHGRGTRSQRGASCRPM